MTCDDYQGCGGNCGGRAGGMPTQSDSYATHCPSDPRSSYINPEEEEY